MPWTPEAEIKLKEIPFFVRPAVRRRIEALAGDAGLELIYVSFYESAKRQFGQK
ncbi:PCP reductase family protein [Cyanobium sp. ATX 6F1]|uniref:PCP reductase family protein n=1 Tax=unclassified Cyanobium TaxID=2627006 RepID=UPI0020CFC48C|nr:PCP reductase family protein [Cyanobium sp. ATX 6F1]MCP9916524.1 PCP reductase family protein [Cyanobium sp. ATX 6F1]